MGRKIMVDEDELMEFLRGTQRVPEGIPGAGLGELTFDDPGKYGIMARYEDTNGKHSVMRLRYWGFVGG